MQTVYIYELKLQLSTLPYMFMINQVCGCSLSLQLMHGRWVLLNAMLVVIQ